MILLVLNNPGNLDAILTAWEEAGVSGITILPSTGLARIREKGAWRDDLPLIPSLEDFHDYVESLNRTLFTIVPTDEMVDKVIDSTQAITGDLNDPHTGILVTLPVDRFIGIFRNPSGSCS
jgi:nitrogen regulatory protein PII